MKESRIHKGSNIQWIAKIFHAKRQAMTIALKRVLIALLHSAVMICFRSVLLIFCDDLKALSRN